MKSFTFSNGVTIEPGEIVATNIAGVHMDNNLYPNAEKYDGFRFSRMREIDGKAVHAASTSKEFLQFGHGKYAWYILPLLIFIIAPVDSLELIHSS
jgi:cytochrome P450